MEHHPREEAVEVAAGGRHPVERMEAAAGRHPMGQVGAEVVPGDAAHRSPE